MQRLTFDCIKGTKWATYDGNPQIIDKAYTNGKYHDNYFYGSFCPPSSGMYRLIYEGTTLQYVEVQYSKYSFNGNTSKSRVSEYYHLYKGTCYKYKMIHSFGGSNLIGMLYYQKDSQEKVLITKSTSYSCNRDICLPRSRDPRCSAFITIEQPKQNSRIIIIILIFYLISS